MTSASLVDRRALQPVVDVGGIYGCGLFETRGESQARGAMTSRCGSSGNGNGVARISLCEAGPHDGEARSRGAAFQFTTRRVPWASELFVPRKPKPEDRQYPQQSVCESYEWVRALVVRSNIWYRTPQIRLHRVSRRPEHRCNRAANNIALSTLSSRRRPGPMAALDTGRSLSSGRP